jgi:hypothetical protein
LLGEITESEMKEILSDIKLEFSFNDESSVDVKDIIELFKSGLLPKRIAQTKILPRFGKQRYVATSHILLTFLFCFSLYVVMERHNVHVIQWHNVPVMQRRNVAIMA